MADLKRLDAGHCSLPISEESATGSEQSHNNEPAEDVPPNGGYGWVCVACSFGVMSHTFGLSNSYGVFLAHYLSTNSFQGATRRDFALIGGLTVAQAFAVAPVVTLATRYFGTRKTMLIGVVLQTVALIGASFASRMWQLVLSQGVCLGCGMGFLCMGSASVVPQWFTTRRSLAYAISLSGAGFGGLMYSLATSAMIQSIGIGWAFRILGTVSSVVNLTCSLLIKDRNKQVGVSQLAFDRKLLKRVEFLLFLGYGIFSVLGYYALLFSLPNYARSIGLTAKQGSMVGALFNLGQALGRPLIGYFSDAFGRINLAGLMTLLSGVFVLTFWVCSNSYKVLIASSLIGGIVVGGFWATITPVAAEVVGLRVLPSALSIVWVTLTIPIICSEIIALDIVGHSGGNYLGAQLFIGFMYLAATCCLLFLKAWKIGENEHLAAMSYKSSDKIDLVADEKAHKTSVQESILVPHSSVVKRLFVLWPRV